MTPRDPKDVRSLSGTKEQVTNAGIRTTRLHSKMTLSFQIMLITVSILDLPNQIGKVTIHTRLDASAVWVGRFRRLTIANAATNIYPEFGVKANVSTQT